VEWCSSTVSMTPSLGDVAQRGLGDGCAKMDSCRVGALFSVVVASMASLVRGFDSVLHPRVVLAERGVEVTVGACAQDAYFGYHRGVRDGDSRGTMP
jgi:hypothetical protein